MKDRSHDEVMAGYLRTHQAYATELLACVQQDGDFAELAILMRRLGEPFDDPQQLNHEPT